MAAVTPQKRKWELGSYYPAGTCSVSRRCAKPSDVKHNDNLNFKK